MQNFCMSGGKLMLPPINGCASPCQTLSIISPTSGRKLSLSPRNQKLIIRSWESIADPQLLGQNIFTHVFMRKPSLMRLWGLEAVPVTELPQSALFIRHAQSFSMFIDIAVRSLISSDPQNVVHLARDIGKKHVEFKQVSFDAEYWLLFKSALVDCVTEGNPLGPQTRDIWNLFMMFIIMEMKDAFYSETKRKHSVVTPEKIEAERQNLYQQLSENFNLCLEDNNSVYSPSKVPQS